MAWNYPEISFEDFMKLVKGFVDILILASGYQSSGLVAHWDAENCRKALQWGLFFENVLWSITSSQTYGESVRALDEAISEMKSNPLFPQGLENLSANTLSNARAFVLNHLMNNLPLRDKHLRAIMVATVGSGDYVMDVTAKEILKRQSAVSCVLTLEMGLDILSQSIENGCWTKEPCAEPTSSGRWKELVELSAWSSWKSNGLSYFLNKRTVRLVSGASLIFSAPKIQWAQVLERLCFSSESDGDIFLEKIELLLLGCLASTWTNLVKHLTSVSYKSVTMSEQREELCKLLLRISRSSNQHKSKLNPKVEEILDYLNELLANRVDYLWKMPSALTAAAIPSWSPLFHLYFGEIETQLKLDFSTRSCNQDVKGHKDGEVAERVWCLYIFHVCGFHHTD